LVLDEEANEADPEDPLRETLQSRPSREGGFRREMEKKRVIKNRNALPHDYSMYEPRVHKKPSNHDINQRKPPMAGAPNNLKSS